jgi:ribosomal protein S18 acetylase RimI-like enzyme
MDCDQLYRVKKEDIVQLKELLTECFESDPLYCRLIPDKKKRVRLLPRLFACDMEELLKTCQIYADSQEIRGIIVVEDEAESIPSLRKYISEAAASLKTDGYLIKEDPSFRTFWNFYQGRDYLNSKWTETLNIQSRLHIIYLAVRPTMQHRGISANLLKEAIRYADKNKRMISLETHNEKNVSFYRHFGFELYEIVETLYDLKQFCMIRESKNV